MQQTWCVSCVATFLKEGKQTAPLQFIEFLFSYKTQPHLGEKYLLILFAASVTQKTRQMVVIDITCPCSIFKEGFFCTHTNLQYLNIYLCCCVYGLYLSQQYIHHYELSPSGLKRALSILLIFILYYFCCHKLDYMDHLPDLAEKCFLTSDKCISFFSFYL